MNPESASAQRRPDVALRVDATRGAATPCWLLAYNAAWSCRSSDAQTLLSEHLPEALARLAVNGEGLLVGLLPYPDGTPGTRATPATLQLFSGYRTASGLPAAPGSFRLTSPFRADDPADTYLGAVARVLEYLRAGDAYQVNLAQRFSAGYAGDPWTAFVTLANAFAPRRAAWLQMPDRALLSLSPETFLELDHRQVVTRPIKGTRPRGRTPEEDAALADDLRNNAKDRAENLMIVDLLRNDLGRVCRPGSVRTEALFALESHRNVHHLVSTVRGELTDGSGIPELLLATFPGGSITGAPKRRAMEIIHELEPWPRDVYCGSVFWVTGDGRLGSNILIRSFLALDQALHGWAGAGIVADSSPQGEFAECLAKLGPLMHALEGIDR